ncbi:unnamed protein product [Bursaphelenchus xylophilus]|uniref:(pine wood nematode) hypothetical protein n=1 Tax=Bursaphelenchus xylophilus TaxID=6326 RepID=A0A1I7RMD1_BURXY|nr:unnamed protein product [Bursaphelenchus xylophilus]CAG9118388.1 unnamed protein product [Bursaphelenchus xylophilus]
MFRLEISEQGPHPNPLLPGTVRHTMCSAVPLRGRGQEGGRSEIARGMRLMARPAERRQRRGRRKCSHKHIIWSALDQGIMDGIMEGKKGSLIAMMLEYEGI